MDILQMELGALINLWECSDHNLILKKGIEIELQKRIHRNSKFCREYFFLNCKLQNHSMNVSFIPSSEAYKNFGPNLTMDIILSEEEMQEQFNNYRAIPPIQTTGFIRAKIIIKDNFSAVQINMAADSGFHTRDVFETF